MKIEILGSGCAKCRALSEVVKNAVAKKGIFAQVEKVEDVQKIMEYRVMNTPAIVIDGVIKSSGKVLSEEEVIALLD